MKGLARLGTLWNSIQSWLFPALECGTADHSARASRALIAINGLAALRPAAQARAPFPHCGIG